MRIKEIIFICLLIFLCMAGMGCGGSNPSEKSSVEAENKHRDAVYVEAVNLAKQGQWRKCVDKIFPEKSKNDNAMALYNYGQAKVCQEYTNPLATIRSLERIPDTYSGEFASDIKDMKEKLYPLKEQALKDTENDKKKQFDEIKATEKERASKIFVGDREDKIETLLGKPDQVNRTVSGNLVQKQFVYHRNNKLICIYTEDGIVTAFQD